MNKLRNEIILNVGSSKVWAKQVACRLSAKQKRLLNQRTKELLHDIIEHFQNKNHSWPLAFKLYEEMLIQPLVGPIDYFFMALLLEKGYNISSSDKGFMITKGKRK